MEGLQIRAIAKYKAGQYGESVKLFDQAIHAATASKVPASKQVLLLDQRAACHEKRQDFDSALSDGKKMIKIAPNECIGYLRTGKVLQLKDKDSFAHRVYSKGLKNSQVNDSLYGVLERVRNKVKQKLETNIDGVKRASFRDPVEVLPYEMLHDIFSRLPFKNLVNCLRVSKHWYNHLTTDYALWYCIDLRQSKRPVSHPKKVIQRYMEFSKKQQTELYLHRMNVSNEEQLFQWLFINGHLSHFESLDLVFYSDKIRKWLVELSQLKIPLSEGQKPKQLSIQSTACYEHAFLLLSALPSLESFQWHDSGTFGDAPLVIDLEKVISKVSEFNLTSLSIHSSRRSRFHPDNLMSSLLHKSPHITELDISLNAPHNWTEWVSILPQNKLTSLKISLKDMIPIRSLPFELLTCLKLDNLELNDGLGLSMVASYNLSNLTQLDLTGLKFIERGLSKFFEHYQCGSNLTTLILNYCRDGYALSTINGYTSLIGKYCPRLERLSFLGSSSVCDKTIEGVIKSDNDNHLKQIDLSATHATGLSMINLVKHGVSAIGIEGCDISSDTYAWLRKQQVMKPSSFAIVL
jgi:hypothetical protein